VTAQSGSWHPSPKWLTESNLARLIRRLGVGSYEEFLSLSVNDLEKYWQATLEHLQVTFDPPPSSFLDVSRGDPWASFFADAGFNFAAACTRVSEMEPSRVAVSWEDESGRRGELSYEDLHTRTRNLAAGLQQLGVKPGDRIGFLFPNTAEAVITFLAIGLLGAISVPLYSGYGSDAVANRLADAGAKILIAADGFVRRNRYISLADLAKTVAESVQLEQVVLVRNNRLATPEFPHASWHEVEQAGAACDFVPHRTAANDPFMIIYTSGTTGRPKGAVHVHAGFPLRVAQDVAFLFDFRTADRYFWMSDMGWMVGPFSMCSALINKGTLVLYDGAPDVPDVGRLRAVAARHRVTHFGSSPTAIRMMAANEAAALATQAPDLRVLMTGGEVIDPDSHHWFFNKFGHGELPIINYTGGTEVSGALLSNVVLRPIVASRFNSTAPGVNVEILNSEGHSVVGAPGELAITRPFVGKTQGFWNDSARYLETYWSRFPGKWVHGDLALQEPDGQFLLIGRSDDVMKIAGRRVGPSEIEGMVIDSQWVADAIAFGTPDSRSGEVLVLLVLPQNPADGPRIEEQVATRLKSRMGPGFKPHAVVVARRLAKTRNGKPLRRLARDAWLGKPPGDLSSLEDHTIFADMTLDCQTYRSAKRP
jgi:acetyl-CoA synthetase